MIRKRPKFLIVVTGFNCAEFVPGCMASINAQTYNNFEAVFVDDASTDSTWMQITRCRNEKNATWEIRKNDKNMGAAFNRYMEIKSRPDDFIILLMGMDDMLFPDALKKISEYYERGAWMTYGNWIDQHGAGLPADFALHFDEQTHADRSYREVKYRSTAPNTFYAHLFKRIPPEDFKLNGEWIDTTTESEVMFSCLEMCGKDRIGVIEEPIYIYNRNLPGGTQRRLGQDYKNKVYQQIIKRTKRELIA